ncbi:MAG: hypothetical protein K0U84_24610 [Actinomycetia bacterium]|nr:hypothetical protein [Actinomycetes bacterium]
MGIRRVARAQTGRRQSAAALRLQLLTMPMSRLRSSRVSRTCPDRAHQPLRDVGVLPGPVGVGHRVVRRDRAAAGPLHTQLDQIDPPLDAAGPHPRRRRAFPGEPGDPIESPDVLG